MAGIWSRFFGSSISTATGYGIGSALGPALRPVTQEVANEAWTKYPNRPLSPDDIAEAEIRQALGSIDALAEAMKSGTNEQRLDVLRLLAGQPPGEQQLLEMWNRGFIGPDDVDRGLRQSRLRPEWYPAYKRLRNVLVPVSDLIRMAVREVFTPGLRQSLSLDADYPGELTARASELGLSEENARDYWAAHWDLPSATQMAQMMFRGELSEQEFEQGLRALDYAPTWRQKLSTILRPIPSLSDMVRFAVREVYDPAKRAALGLDAEFPQAFATAAAMHGFSEEYAKQEWAAHWKLPSAQQGYRMLWREEINAGELDALLKALDYPTLWRNRLSNIAHLAPGRVDLRRMLAADVVDRAYVKKGYQHIGYDEPTAEILTKFAEQQAASGSTVHQKWADRAKSRLFTITHNEYLDDSLDVAGANEALDVVGVPAAERQAIFAAWDKENAIARIELTAAQIKKAYAGAGITRDEAVGRLVDKGMTAADADLFLDPTGGHQ